MKPAAESDFVREFERNYKKGTTTLINCNHQEICSRDIIRTEDTSKSKKNGGGI
jgi:hypothetical protein